MNFLLNENIFLLNKEILINELNNYNYVESFKVSKYYPSKIIINLKQTNLLAVTVENNKKYFIGSNGKLIDYEVFDQNFYLPNFFGKFSKKEFISFINVINQTSFNYNEISDIFFFKSGRWDIKTKDHQTIKLPKENLKKGITVNFGRYLKVIFNKNLKNKKKPDK